MGKRRTPRRKQHTLPTKRLKSTPTSKVSPTVINGPKTKKDTNFSPKFDLFSKKELGDLTIAEINIEKMGKAKRKELGKILKENKIDLLAVIEHHINPLNRDDNLDVSVKDHPSLHISGYKVYSKHRETGSGGVAWYYRKDLDIEPWENIQTQVNLKVASRERCWITIRNTQTPFALGAAYLPVETTTDLNNDKYQNILDILSDDMDKLEREGFKCFLYGDFNAHVGTPLHNPLGIEGNKQKVGQNGERLLTWLEFRNMILVNSLPNTEGLWTYQSHNGLSLSILDYVICSSHHAQYIKGLLIDDNREITTINNDHNMIISILKTNHKHIQWPKPPPKMKWDYEKTNKTVFRDVLSKSVKKYCTKRKTASEILENISNSFNEALKASTKRIPCKPKNKKLPPEIISVQDKIKAVEKDRNRILKDHRGSTNLMDQDTINLLNTLNDNIKELRQKKQDLYIISEKTENKKLKSLVKERQNSSKAFWSLAKPKDENNSINVIKQKDGSLTKTHEEALERVREHYQDLFSPRERPPNTEPIKIPSLGKTKHLVKDFKPKQIRKALNNLEPGKASGPDEIPNEILKLGSSIIYQQLCTAFNIILRTGESIHSWAGGHMHLLYKDKGDKADLNNYRGITINNCISKVFTSLLTDRLAETVERSGVLGQIQGGGRKNRRGLDNLFILRTILEKSSGKGKTSHPNLSLLFVDLKKAFDKVPHDLLWEKLSKMGLHHRFITVLKSLYHNSYVEVYVNGLKTKKVWIRSGVKQGCPLSPLLWALFICDIGQFLEKSKTGTLIYGVIISALFFVDDLVLIGKTLSDIEKIIKICNYQFLLNGLEINCSKSKVLTKEKVQTDHFDLHNLL